jgi:threonine dehydrogenase-like Zn-dependent dehydrogenase
MAQKFGAEHIITSRDPYDDIAKLAHGTLYKGMFNNKMITGGFDVIFDCVGSARSVTDSLRWARAGGTVVLVGVSLEQLKIDLSPVWYQEVDLIGTLAHGMEQVNGTKKSTYDLTCEMLLQGKLTTEDLITHYFKLDDWKKAVKTSLDKRKGVIKVALDYR